MTVLLLALAVATSPLEAPSVHTRLEESWPAEDARATEPVEEIRLRFSTPVQAALSRIRVLNASGAEVPLGRVRAVQGTEDHQIRAALTAPLPSGRYVVEWGTAGPDGHPISGEFEFRVERPEAAVLPDAVPRGAPPPAPDEAASPAGAMDADGGLRDALAPAGLVVRWLYFVTIALMVGTAAVVLLVIAPAAVRGESAAPRALRGARGLALLAGGVALLVAAGRLGMQARSLFGLEAPDGALATLVFGSAWGWAWILSVAGAALVLVGAAAGRSVGRLGPWWVVAAGAGLAVLSRVPSGHAWGVTGGARILAVAADGIHLLGAGLWVGALGVLALVALPVLAREDGAEQSGDAALWVHSFSRVALAGFLLLAASGVASASVQIGSLAGLTGTVYGRTLLVKLALLVAPLALGFYHWRVVRPRLAAEVPPGFRRTAVLEFALGLTVVAAAAVLVVLHLPEH